VQRDADADGDAFADVDGTHADADVEHPYGDEHAVASRPRAVS
jgi:hypothetical protein